MYLTLPPNGADSDQGTVYKTHIIVARIFKKRAYLVFVFFVAAHFSNAQSVSPATMNISGQSATFGNYQFEWSVGESTSVITTTNSNLLITTGVLQTAASAPPAANTANIFFPDEIKIYPNPTKDIVEINILHHIAGKNKLELFDRQGRKVMEKQFEYNGMGRIEKWDLSKLAAGQYFLSIQLFDTASGGTRKKGAFKIIKIQ